MNPKEQLIEALTFKTVSSLKVAEEIAEQFMQCGKCRNIIRARGLVTTFMAATIYRMARHQPLRVKKDSMRGMTDYTGTPIVPIRCRSKSGDISHLVVFLTYAPHQIIPFLLEDPDVAAYLKMENHPLREEEKKEHDTRYMQLTNTMSQMVVSRQLSEYMGPEFSFRCPVELVKDDYRDEVDIEMFKHANVTFEEQVFFIQSELMHMANDKQVHATVSMEVLGSRLRELRVKMNLTQRELAEKIGVKELTVTRMESGSSVSAPVLLQFLAYFSQFVSIDVVFDGKVWEFAMQNPDFMIKKVHLLSIINRKMKLMRKHFLERLAESQQNLNTLMGEIYRESDRNLESAISLTEDS